MTAPESLDVVLCTGPLSPEDVVAVARHGAGVRLSDDAVAAIERDRLDPPDLDDGPLLGGRCAQRRHGTSLGGGTDAPRPRYRTASAR